MWQERQAELLREEIEAILVPLLDIPSLYDLVKESLTKTRQELTTESVHDHPWPLIPLIVCEAVSGYYEHALPVAAAFQIFKAAAEVFDDIEDADSSESLSSRYGSALATNTATTLFILAERAITRLEARGVADHTIIRVMDTVNSFSTTACAGQHLDLSLNPGIAVSEDMYLRVAGMKSASTVKCACHIGALLAATNEKLIDVFDIFGENLGVASQIANDVLGITRGNDILKRKITLPVIYALAKADGETHDQLVSVFGQRSETLPSFTQIKDLLFRTGAIHYTMIKMEFYRQQALDILSELKRAGVNIKRLKLFLE